MNEQNFLFIKAGSERKESHKSALLSILREKERKKERNEK